MNTKLLKPKFFLSIGGLFGFSIAMGAGLLVGNELGIVIRDASIGCFIGAILMKRFLNVICSSISAARLEKGKDTSVVDDKTPDGAGRRAAASGQPI